VSWPMCDQLFTRHGLILPTEAQWERGCRGGTSTPWFTGDRPQGLEGFANVLDETGRSVPPRWEGGEAFDDHFKEAAPVGTYGPNPFGLYDVHGNVFEWCREWFGRYFSPPRAGDGLLQPGPSNTRAVRGGDYRSAARPARSSQRHQLAPSAQGGNVGVRPAREIAR